jgi:hypothetical protein
VCEEELIKSSFQLRFDLTNSRIALALAGIGFVVVGLLSGAQVAVAAAGINQTINFQGRLLTAGGAVVPDGNYNMEFRVYQDGPGNVANDTGGTKLWTEDWMNSNSTPNPVVVKNGYFSVALGTYCPVSGAACTGGQSQTNSAVNFNSDTLWLSMNVAGTPNQTSSCAAPFTTNCSPDGEMLPMKRLSSAVYALNAQQLGGLTASQFAQLAANQTFTGTNTFQPATNITGLVAKQTSGASFGADIFDVQTQNGTAVIQATGPAVNESALLLQSVGATRDLTLNSGSGTVVLGTSVSTIKRVAAALSIDLNQAGTSTLTVTNSDASNVANVSVEGAITTGTTVTAPTAVISPLHQTTDVTGASAGLTLRSGNSTSAGNTGTVTIASGTATSGNSGDISIDSGGASGTKGSINIGATNAPAIGIGAATGSTTTIAGGNVAHTVAIAAAGTSSTETVTVGSTGSASILTLQAGTAGASLLTGATAAASTASGNLSITTGNASGTGVTSNSGSITLNVGTSTNGTPGAINIGTANIANMVQLGSTALNAGTQVVAIGNNNTAGGTTNVTIGSGTSATGGTTTLQAKGALTVAGGTVAIRPAAAGNDAAGAVQIQNSSGAALLSADTSAMRLSVGTIGTATGQLYVAGKLPTAAVATLGTGASTAPGGLYVQGRYAYVVLNAASPKLQIIDISNPSSPALLGSVATGAGPAKAYVQGRYAYVTNNTANTLQIFDVSNPNAPTSVSTLSIGTAPLNVVVQGRYAYVTITNPGAGNPGSLQIVDVSNPLAPVLVSTTTTGDGNDNEAYGLAVQGNYAYITNTTDGTIQAVNIANPASPSLGTAVTVDASAASKPGGLFVQGRYAYVPVNNDNKLQIFDLKDPGTPVAGATVATGLGPLNAYVQGRYAYIVNFSDNPGTVQIVDVSNPASLVSVGTVNAGTTGGPGRLFAQGRYLYVTNRADNNFYVYDLGGEYAQQLEAGGTETGTLSVLNDAAVGGNAAVVGGLQVGQSLQVNGNAGVAGSLLVQGGSSATALQVADANGAALLTVDTTARSGSGGNLLKVGNSTGTDTATTILQLDATTAAPTTNLVALNGGLFYNSTTNKVSIIENGTVKALCNTTDLSCGAGGSGLAKNATDTSAFTGLGVGAFGYTFTNNTSPTTASGVLKLDNSGNTGSTLLLTGTATQTDLAFGSGVNRRIGVQASTAGISGYDLTVQAGAGTASAGTVVAGGNLNFSAGASAGSTAVTGIFAGGSGGSINLTATAGQDANSASAVAAGAGGGMTVTLGAGGGSFNAADTPGVGGALSLTGGIGGGRNTAGTAGTGGGLVLQGGTGGLNSLAAGTGGLGGAVQIKGGSGSAQAGVGGIGGAGGNLSLTAGTGGNGATTNGSGGALFVQGGDAGAGAGTGGSGGDVNIQPGLGGTTAGKVSIFPKSSSATNSQFFTIQDGSAGILFTANNVTRTAGVAGNTIKIGDSAGTDTTTTILQLDATTAAPTTNLASLNGGLFYNSTTNKISIIENGTVKVLCNTTDLSCGSGGGGLSTAPTTTLQNTVQPATSAVVAMTLNGTNTGTAAQALIINQAFAADAENINLTNTTGTQTNGWQINRNGAGGTTTNAVSIVNTAGTLTNGLSFTGTIGTDINRGAGTLKIQGAGGVNILSSGGNITLGTSDTTGTLLVLDIKTGTGDPTGTNGGMYYNSAMHQYRCYRGVNATAGDGAWEACGTNPIDEGFEINDEFVTGTTTSGGVGDMGWNLTAISGGACTISYNNTTPAISSSTPGTLRCTTGTTQSTGGIIFLAGAGTLGTMQMAAGYDVKTAVAPGSTVNPSQILRVGMHNQSGGAQTVMPAATTGLWWEANLASSANWRYCYGNGTAVVCANSTVAVAANTFSRFEIRVNALGAGTSSADFFVNGTKFSVSAVTIDNTNRVNPAFSCLKTSVAVSSETCSIDYYQVRGFASAAR